MLSETVQKDFPFPPGVFRIRNKGTQNFLTLTSTAGILAQTRSDSDYQRWIVTKTGTVDKNKGEYSFTNLADQGYTLGYRTSDSNKPLEKGAKVEGSQDFISWTIWKDADNVFKIGTTTPKLLMDDEKGTPRVNLNDESGKSEQQWEIVVLEQPSDTAANDRKVKVTISSGRKYFIRNFHDALVLTIGNKKVNDKATDGVLFATQVQMNLDQNSALGQIWSCNVKSNGTFELFEMTTRRYLTVDKAGAYQEVTSSSNATEWQLNSLEDEVTWTITAPQNGLALGFTQPKPQNSDKAYMVPSNMSQNQIWFFDDLDIPATVTTPSSLEPPLAPQPNPIPAPTPIPTIAWRHKAAFKSCSFRNRESNLFLSFSAKRMVINSEIQYSVTLLDNPTGTRLQTWEVKEGGDTKEYSLHNEWSDRYASSSDGLSVNSTSDTSVNWCFEIADPADTRCVYICPTKHENPRVVITDGEAGKPVPITSFEVGNRRQMWIAEPLVYVRE